MNVISGKEITIFAPEPESQKVFANIPDFHTINKVDLKKIYQVKHLFIEMSASRLPEISHIIKTVHEYKHLRALFIRADMDSNLLPQMFHRADLRIARNVLVHPDFDWVIPKRVMNAWKMGAEHDLIATATVLNKKLYVLNCAFEKYEVNFDSIPALNKIPASNHHLFEIDKAGSFLYWPKQDIHIDIEELRYAVDEKWRIKTDRDRLIDNARFGKAITDLREEAGLSQKDIFGLSDRQIRRIEKGIARPGIGTMRSLATAHKMELDKYLESIGTKISKMKA